MSGSTEGFAGAADAAGAAKSPNRSSVPVAALDAAAGGAANGSALVGAAPKRSAVGFAAVAEVAKSAKMSPDVPDVVLRLLCPADPGGGARGAGELGTDALDPPGLADMTILGTKDLGPAVAALVSSKSSSSSKLAKLGCDELCAWWDGAAAGAAAWCERPDGGADLAEEENASTCPPLIGPPPRRSSSRLSRPQSLEADGGAGERGTAPLRIWSDDMPPYLFWFAIALSRAAAMAAGSLRSCGERGGMRDGQKGFVQSITMEVGGTGKTGREAVGVASDPPELSADLAVDGHVNESS